MSNRPPMPGKSKTPNASPRIKEMLRVDHAGEYAAVTIYEAQAKVFGRSPRTKTIAAEMKHMREEEQIHLDAFNTLLREHKTRPTAMTPLWHFASKTLGTVTALMGEKAAHACTEAVETVIEQHYAAQIAETKDSHPELCAKFTKFREDELSHRDHAVAEGAHDAPAYGLLSAAIKLGCRTAIKISEKV